MKHGVPLHLCLANSAPDFRHKFASSAEFPLELFRPRDIRSPGAAELLFRDEDRESVSRGGEGEGGSALLVAFACLAGARPN